MTKLLGIAAVLIIFIASGFSQTGSGPKLPTNGKPGPPAAEDGSLELARSVVTAHGGEKLTKMSSLIVRGSVDVTGAFSQVIPATFLMVISGDRYVFELNNPIQPLKQVFDGKQKYSTGYDLPPVTSLGFPLLSRINDLGYAVAALPEAKKKKRGFRVTTPEGFYTDFLINEKTGQIKGYDSSYDINGRLVTTSVEIDEFQTVEGVVIPKKYSQRFDLGQLTAYANFKVRETLVNSTLADDVFAIPK